MSDSSSSAKDEEQLKEQPMITSVQACSFLWKVYARYFPKRLSGKWGYHGHSRPQVTEQTNKEEVIQIGNPQVIVKRDLLALIILSEAFLHIPLHIPR